MLCFHHHSVQVQYFLISLDFFFFFNLMGYLKVLFNSHTFESFLHPFLLLISNLKLFSKNILDLFSPPPWYFVILLSSGSLFSDEKFVLLLPCMWWILFLFLISRFSLCYLVSVVWLFWLDRWFLLYLFYFGFRGFLN